MVALQMVSTRADGTVESATTIPGYEPENCIITNTSGLELPLVWTPTPPTPVAPGSKVQLRFYFRDSTIYAVGAK